MHLKSYLFIRRTLKTTSKRSIESTAATTSPTEASTASTETATTSAETAVSSPKSLGWFLQRRNFSRLLDPFSMVAAEIHHYRVFIFGWNVKEGAVTILSQ